MLYLNIDERKLMETNAIHTVKEIAGQPALYIDLYNQLFSEHIGAKEFLDEIFKKLRKIVLNGAGTNAFTGYSLKGMVYR